MVGAGSHEQLSSLLERVLREYTELARETNKDADKRKDHKLIVVVSNEAAKAIIGKGGENVNRLKDEFGCIISVSQQKVDLGNSVSEQVKPVLQHIFIVKFQCDEFVVICD